MRIAKVATSARARLKKADAAQRAPRVTVQYATSSKAVPSPAHFRKWVRAALAADAEVTVRLVGLKEGRELNRAFRGRDYATNVLTFVLQDRVPYEGDLALCAPVVVREAREQGKSLPAHYAHLTVHGVLHLQGYEHEHDADAAKMEKLEARIMKRLGYPDPYMARPEHG